MVQEEIVICLPFLCLVLCQSVVAFVGRDGDVLLVHPCPAVPLWFPRSHVKVSLLERPLLPKISMRSGQGVFVTWGQKVKSGLLLSHFGGDPESHFSITVTYFEPFCWLSGF